MQLGLITYNVAKDWDLSTLVERVRQAGWTGVELRTQHAHGVEIDIDSDRRREVRQRFEDAGITIWALGTTCEFQSETPSVVAQNVEETKRWCELAESIGARGVKVRPNGLPKNAELQQVLERIGDALRDCGAAAARNGVEIFLEVHGSVTQDPINIRKILEHCGHPQVGACWNSNPTDLNGSSVKASFDLLQPYIRSCHINDLWNSGYPYRELFELLRSSEYEGFTLCEVASPIPAEFAAPFLNCYRALWLELQRS